MTTLSNEAFAVMAACERTKQPFGITAQREGYGKTNVKGNIILDTEYPGCPYCGEKRHIVCSSCNKFFCYHGQEHVTCPNCGTSGNVVSIEQVDLKGGDY